MRRHSRARFRSRLPAGLTNPTADRHIDMLGHPVCGLSYEGHCIENLLQVADTRRMPYFYRT